MCGIAGYIKFNNSSLRINSEEMINIIRHRGPDNISCWSKNNVSLAHARLSIIDLSDDGKQPQHFEHLHIVFNGELYNYKELRKQLIDKGYHFNTHSDTEVILKAYHFWKEDCVNKFIGMFAIVIYDDKAHELIAFRDRIGIKPFYYMHKKDSFIFASEPRALYPHSNRNFDLDAIQEYFSFGYIGKEKSVYKDVRRLLPAHILKIKNNEITIKQYWQIPVSSDKSDSFGSASEIPNQLEALMSDAFEHHMVSDVPVGVLLSGGTDSSLVTALLSSKHPNLATFTLGFVEKNYNEAPIAKKVSQQLQTTHYEKILDMETAKQGLNDFYHIYDEPFADSSGIPTSIIAAYVRENNYKVVLSADGGDELFGGYSRYQSVQNLYGKLSKLPRFSRKALSAFLRSISKIGFSEVQWKNLGAKMMKFTDILNSEEIATLYQQMISNDTEMKAKQLLGIDKPSIFRDSWLFEKSNAHQAMMNWDFLNYLPDNLLVKMDRATMFHGVEGRVPILDHRLVESVIKIPPEVKIQPGYTKSIMKNLLKRYLPDSLVDLPKKGFNAPLFDWFSSEIDKMFDTYLSPDLIKETNIFNTDIIQAEVTKYHYFKAKKMPSNMERIWRMLSFMLWWDKYHYGH